MSVRPLVGVRSRRARQPRKPYGGSARVMGAKHFSSTRSPARRRMLFAAWLLAASVIGARALQIQAFQSEEWRELASRQHRSQREALAPRGRILDRDGIPLAVSRERFKVAVAPREIVDGDEVSRLLRDNLGISTDRAERLTNTDRAWSVVPGHHPPTVLAHLSGIPGVYLEAHSGRHLPQGDLVAGLIGVVREGFGQGGVEQALDEILRGSPGLEVLARDHAGKEIPGKRHVTEPPVPGMDIVLTIDVAIQEIARQAIDDAVAESGAEGGDIVVTDPRTGEILALASVRNDEGGLLSAINTPYEPGSTLKPFTVAGLLENGFATLADSVDVGDGTWSVAGRVLRDVASTGSMTLADALRLSSNVGVAKVASRSTPGAQYEILRDFGFGSPAGIDLPGEVAGTLRRPDAWSRQSPASLAIGYEISVTPLQMAMAYGALANGGRLMEPTLVREVRDRRGNVVRSSKPSVVRRVVSAKTAAAVSRVLVDVVEAGTGRSARIRAFRVAGKSGTARLYDPGKGYEPNAYASSFVGFFPAEAPQLVVVVKLERPRGEYYGGAVAAPVTRAAVEAVLASRASHIDRAALISVAAGIGAPLTANPAQSRLGILADQTTGGAVPAGGLSDEAEVFGPTTVDGLLGTRWSPPSIGRVATARFASSYRIDGAPEADIGSWRALARTGSLLHSRDSEGSWVATAPSGSGDGGPTRQVDSRDVQPTGSGPPPSKSLVPDVAGLASRDAARRLHAAGLRVVTVGPGKVVATNPPAGAGVVRGDTIRLITGGG